MTDIKSKVQGMNANLKARDLADLSEKTLNIYETLTVIRKRANQLSTEIKYELHGKLDEFAIQTDNIEEIHENKEQIEISKFYERMPNPTVIATEEYLSDNLETRIRGKEDREVKEENPSA